MEIPREERMSHTWVLGAPGAGKTTLLKNLILDDLKAPDQPSVVVIESQADLVPAIARLDILRHRNVILIDPQDTEYPPAINIFDVGDLQTDKDRDRVARSVGDILTYIFREEDAKLSSRQNMVFEQLCRLMIAYRKTHNRNATLFTLLEFLVKPPAFQSTIATLNPTARLFFQDFLDPKSGIYRHTREQIRSRLFGILSDTSLEQLFAAENTRVDLKHAIDNGYVILIDTSAKHLQSTSSLYGKIFLHLLFEAARKRAGQSYKHDTLVYIDECHEYFDGNLDATLLELRKQRMGCILAHQKRGHATPALQSSLHMTAVKFVGKPIDEDARALAADMHTTREFLMNLPKHHFGLYVRDHTSEAVSVHAPDYFSNEPRMSDWRYDDFIDENREAVSYTPQSPAVPDDADDDDGVSDE